MHTNQFKHTQIYHIFLSCAVAKQQPPPMVTHACDACVRTCKYALNAASDCSQGDKGGAWPPSIPGPASNQKRPSRKSTPLPPGPGGQRTSRGCPEQPWSETSSRAGASQGRQEQTQQPQIQACVPYNPRDLNIDCPHTNPPLVHHTNGHPCTHLPTHDRKPALLRAGPRP